MKVNGFLLTLVLCGMSVDHAWGQSLVPPSISSISPSRGTAGTTFDATIMGDHLTDVTAVNVVGTGVSVTILSGRTDTALPVRVSIATDAAIGGRGVLLTAPAGTSSGRVILTVVGGGWTSTGSLGVARGDHTATLLLDGTVLVVGGGVCLPSAETYDPAKANWSLAGFLVTGRCSHTATLLPTGKVLVTGGYTPNRDTTASAELYDPLTRAWTAVPPMQSPRAEHSATLLPSGKVLVVGGYTRSGGIPGFGNLPLSTVELFDPDTNSWTPQPPLPTGRGGYTATLLANGKVLFAGLLFDPSTMTWGQAGNLAGTATMLPDGKVLVVDNFSPNAEIFDPATENSTRTGSMTTSRVWYTAVPLPNGKVIVTGGRQFSGSSFGVTVDTTESFDLSTRTWTTVDLMNRPRERFVSVLLYNNKVLAVGGYASANEDGTSAELFDPVVSNPIPSISSIAPNVLRTGVATQLVQVSGTGFLPNSSTFIGNIRLVTQYLGSTRLLAFVPGSFLTAPTTLQITVTNPSPGGGTSSPLLITAENLPPVLPMISALTPPSGVVGTTFSASISGTNLAGATAVTFSGSGVSASIGAGATATNLPIVITIAGNAEPGPRTVTVSTVGGVSSPFSGFVIESRIPRPTTAPQPITEVEQGTVQVGYVVITPDPNTAPPLTTLAYGTVQNGVVQDQAGIASFGLTTGATLFGDILNSTSRNIGLAIANPTSTTNAITITLKNDDGSNVGVPATINIEPYRQVARFLSELFSAAVLGQSFVGSINIQSGTPFAVLAFPFASVNFSALPARNTGTVSGVPTRILTAGAGPDNPRAGTIGGSDSIVLPQFALGGGWATKIALVNGSGSMETGRIDIFDANGQPLAVKLNGTTQSTFPYAIPTGGTFVLAPRDTNGQSPL